MNLGDLQTARSKERQKDSLQHLPEDFYTDVGAFIGELRTERERAAEAAEDPFDAPEVRRLTDDIKSTENTVEAIYERRVGKLVKLASLAAAGMPADEDGLTAEEQDLFRRLVEAIESNRAHVLDGVLVGGNDSATADSGSEPIPESDSATDTTPNDAVSETSDDAAEPSSAPEPSDTVDATDEPNGPPPRETADVSAADVMGADTSASADESPTDEPPAADRAPAGADDAGGETPERDTDRTTVRITRDIGEIFGVDERTYHLAAEDVVTLPEVNAAPLLERDAAEQLD
ncbi:MAG TPA: hypothetical protein VFJ06_07345 [Halococcus sp.]|nr:hypothetical protein [Halococcus sp.]